MKRTIVSFLIIFSLAFAGFPANANALDENLDTVINELLDFSPEDRENLITILHPLVIIDSGVDTLIGIIEDHDGAESSMFGEYVEVLLGYCSKEDIITSLKAVKIIPEDVRETYFGVLVNREEITLSNSNMDKFGVFVEGLYEEISGLEQIMLEDNISEKTIAKFLKFIPAANGNKPVLKVNSEYEFSVNSISKTIVRNFEKFNSETGSNMSAEEFVSHFSGFLNSKYVSGFRKDIAEVLSELGICYLKTDEDNKENDSSSGSISGGSFGDSDDFEDVITQPENKIAFTDIEGWYKEYILSLADKGIVSGRGNGLFCPNDSVTREEFVKMICLALNLAETDAKLDFADVDESAWYAKYIKTAYYHGIIKGQSAQYFGIGKNISRQDAAVICSNVVKTLDIAKIADITFADEQNIAPYAKDAVYRLAEIGIINGDNAGNFNPYANLTRGESAKIIKELMGKIADK